VERFNLQTKNGVEWVDYGISVRQNWASEVPLWDCLIDGEVLLISTAKH
jgi:hypothetical protein